MLILVRRLHCAGLQTDFFFDTEAHTVKLMSKSKQASEQKY